MSLSDKIDWADGGDHNIRSEDVKEFVRKLKFEMELTWRNAEILNKLAGDKLNG